MADISVIQLPSGSSYNIKDAWARQAIEGLGNPTHFLGASSTAITDGGTQKPTIDSVETTPHAGDIVVYNNGEFIWGGSAWVELGDLSGLGSLAYKNSASGSVTPTGTVSKPTFTGSSSTVTITATDNTNGNYQPKGSISGIAWTGASMTSTGKFTPAGSISVGTTTATATVSAASSGTTTYTPGGSVGTPTISVKTAGSTTSINNPTSKTVVTDMSVAEPSSTAATGALAYYSVSGETLTFKQIVETTGASISTTATTVKTGDAAYQSSQPSWTGTAVRLVTGNITVPSGSGTFTGIEGNVSVSGTTTGSISSQGTFTGTKTQLSGSTTAAGSVSQPTFSGDAKTVTVS